MIGTMKCDIPMMIMDDVDKMIMVIIFKKKYD